MNTCEDGMKLLLLWCDLIFKNGIVTFILFIAFILFIVYTNKNAIGVFFYSHLLKYKNELIFYSFTGFYSLVIFDFI